MNNLSSCLFVEQSHPTLNIINGHHSGKVVAIIADGHRIIKSASGLLSFEQDKPWICNGDTFFLNDSVHMFKCLRNNWLTEKCAELEYQFDGIV